MVITPYQITRCHSLEIRQLYLIHRLTISIIQLLRISIHIPQLFHYLTQPKYPLRTKNTFSRLDNGFDELRIVCCSSQ